MDVIAFSLGIRKKGNAFKGIHGYRPGECQHQARVRKGPTAEQDLFQE